MTTGGWDVVRAAVRAQIGPHAYDAWFRTLEGQLADGRLVIRCPDAFSREWIRGRYGSTVERVAPPGCEIHYELAATPPGAEDQCARPAAPATPSVGERPPLQSPSFDSFVAEPGNALALEAARAVARGSAGRCTPLFLSAQTGLGKTHLCRAIHASAGTTGVLYRSSEEFTNEVTQAIRLGQTERIRQRYRRSLNVLILEDVQFLVGKRQTQIELFHTLDELLEQGRSVVLSADRLPHQIQGLETRLASRMASGLVATIAPPELATRHKILREKAAAGGVRLPEEVLELLARRPVHSVRDLIAGLNQVVARASLLGGAITVALATEALAAVGVSSGGHTLGAIMSRVARTYGVELDDLRSRSRRQRVSRPRQFAMYLCRRYTPASLKEIGRAFERDHTSVMYAVDVVEKRVLEQPQLRYELEALVKQL